MKKSLISIGLLISSVTTFYFIFDGFKGDLFLSGKGYLSRFSYYTIQTNLLFAIWLIMLLISRFASPKMEKYLICPLIGQAITIYITITAIVYWAVLVPIFGTHNTFGNLWQHGIVAILAWFFYLIIIPKPFKVDRKKGQLLVLLVYPLGYMTYALVNGIKTGNYIYPFLSPEFMGSPFAVVFAILLISTLFIFIAFILRRIAYR